MEKTRAEAITQAIMEPDLRVQEELRARRAEEAAQLARRRRVAMFMLAGCGIGAVAGHFGGAGFSDGMIWGGLTSAAVGWLVTWRVVARGGPDA